MAIELHLDVGIRCSKSSLPSTTCLSRELSTFQRMGKQWKQGARDLPLIAASSHLAVFPRCTAASEGGEPEEENIGSATRAEPSTRQGAPLPKHCYVASLCRCHATCDDPM